MPDDAWAALVEQGRIDAGCKAPESNCHVTAVVRSGYCTVTHYRGDEWKHECVCAPSGIPHHVISLHSLYYTPREELVASLARWLKHCHEYNRPPGEPAPTPPAGPVMIAVQPPPVVLHEYDETID